MINLTKKIENSNNLNLLWKINGFYLWKELFETLGYQISFWDNEENWATILQEGDIIGYIWNINPLVILKKHITEIGNFLHQYPVEILIYGDFSDKNFILDTECHEKYFPYLSNLFSIDDLWFYSNS